MDEIRNTLNKCKPDLDAASYQNAERTINLISIAVSENREICLALYHQFASGQAIYLNYPKVPEVILHPEQDDMPVEKRAFCYFDTLVSAFKSAQKDNRLMDFFSHAFFPPGDNTICLESAQQVLMSFSEEMLKDREHRNSTDKVTKAPEDAKIFRMLENIVKDMRENTPLDQLLGQTYNQFVGGKKPAGNVEEDEEVEKAHMDKSKTADTAFATLRKQAIALTEKALNEENYAVDFEQIKKCVDLVGYFDAE